MLDGPSVATCSTGTPVLTDMKPRTEKMTKPPKTLVAQLMSDTITESLNTDKHKADVFVVWCRVVHGLG